MDTLDIKNTENAENDVDIEKCAKKVISRFGFVYLLADWANMIFGVLILLFIIVKFPEMASSTTVNLIVSLGTLYICGFLPAYFIVRKLPKADLPRKKIGFGNEVVAFIIVYSIGTLSNLLGSLINVLLGKITGKGYINPINEMIGTLNPVILIVFVAILGPVVEELVFRKILVDRLAQYGEGLTIFASGMMFGLFHANFAQFFYAFFIGVLLAYIYMRTGEIKNTIFIHIGVNSISCILTIIMKYIDMDELEKYLSSTDTEAYMNYVMQNIGVFGLLTLMVGFIMMAVVVGFILAIINRKKFYINHKSGEIEKGKMLKIFFLNPGMMIFVIYFIVMIVLAQCDISLSNVIMGLFK